jgi:hypothetical protein
MKIDTVSIIRRAVYEGVLDGMSALSKGDTPQEQVVDVVANEVLKQLSYIFILDDQVVEETPEFKQVTEEVNPTEPKQETL